MLETLISQALYGVSYGLLLFMLAAGLTLIFSMMGVLNFAHASFYMLGAYIAYQISTWIGFWPALILAPVVLFVIGALVERWGLRRVHKWGHVPELLFTFGLSYIIVELVQVIWGRQPVPYRVPAELDGPVDWMQRFGITFPEYRMFMMAVAIAMLFALWLVLTRTRIGLVIQAALTHPQQVEALGHNVPRVFMLVFGAGLGARRISGRGRRQRVRDSTRYGEYGGSDHLRDHHRGWVGLAYRCIRRCFTDRPAGELRQGRGRIGWRACLPNLGVTIGPETPGYEVLKLTVSQVTPVLPYLLLVLILIVRPKGLLGTRED